MRIAISTWTRRLAGGVETYLGDLVPALLDRGHQVALIHEVDDPADRPPMTFAANVPHWCTSRDGADAALGSLAAWKPDVVFAHGLEEPLLEKRIAGIAPSVLFAHEYRGTCVSGTKSFAALEHATCERRLGWQCLVRYLPHRCGGLDPSTMVRLYRRESQRRDQLDQYAGVVMFSKHIQREYIRHGVAAGRTHVVPCHLSAGRREASASVARTQPSRIIFIGRMETLKGGHVLIEALPLVEASLGRSLHATFVGDGRQRTEWEGLAKRTLQNSASQVEFTGWLAPAERTTALKAADLLVVPSLWPEPFGLIGLEAAACGVPAAAFDVGGISEWLHDGVSGLLAPPTRRAADLAAAIVNCLRDSAVHAGLRRGALEMASRHSMTSHVAALTEVFNIAISPGSRRKSDEPAA